MVGLSSEPAAGQAFSAWAHVGVPAFALWLVPGTAYVVCLQQQRQGPRTDWLHAGAPSPYI
eukprot:666322-Alexandrium_andersonii.AAC.1